MKVPQGGHRRVSYLEGYSSVGKGVGKKQLLCVLWYERTVRDVCSLLLLCTVGLKSLTKILSLYYYIHLFTRNLDILTYIVTSYPQLNVDVLKTR